jgi:hypothetical protein
MRCLLCLSLVVLPQIAGAQTGGAVVPQPAISEYVAAFPRVEGQDSAAQAINARLQELDDGVAGMSDCDLNRKVRVALDSPAYLSIYGSEGGYCEGAAHPFFVEYGLTFDRETGAEVDWGKILPEALLETKSEDYDPNYPFASAALNAVYLAALDPELATGECQEVYAMGLSFEFWMEAGQGVAMFPASLPHAVLACSEVVVLPLATLKSAGMDAKVLAAIETGRGEAP